MVGQLRLLLQSGFTTNYIRRKNGAGQQAQPSSKALWIPLASSKKQWDRYTSYFNRNGNAFNQGQQPSSMSQQTNPSFLLCEHGATMQPPQWASGSTPQGFQLLANGGGGNGIGLPQDLESLAMPLMDSRLCWTWIWLIWMLCCAMNCPTVITTQFDLP
uniref:Uncharacterized protein n=1 Tax=Ditylenchus dipsaci TaxID=166011 RepID=A0A915DXM8_9BILA